MLRICLHEPTKPIGLFLVVFPQHASVRTTLQVKTPATAENMVLCEGWIGVTSLAHRHSKRQKRLDSLSS
jgi:hypothetical protein